MITNIEKSQIPKLGFIRHTGESAPMTHCYAIVAGQAVQAEGEDEIVDYALEVAGREGLDWADSATLSSVVYPASGDERGPLWADRWGTLATRMVRRENLTHITINPAEMAARIERDSEWLRDMGVAAALRTLGTPITCRITHEGNGSECHAILDLGETPATPLAREDRKIKADLWEGEWKGLPAKAKSVFWLPETLWINELALTY